jgi:hypothetical protein
MLSNGAMAVNLADGTRMRTIRPAHAALYWATRPPVARAHIAAIGGESAADDTGGSSAHKAGEDSEAFRARSSRVAKDQRQIEPACQPALDRPLGSSCVLTG